MHDPDKIALSYQDVHQCKILSVGSCKMRAKRQLSSVSETLLMRTYRNLNSIQFTFGCCAHTNWTDLLWKTEIQYINTYPRPSTPKLGFSDVKDMIILLKCKAKIRHIITLQLTDKTKTDVEVEVV